MSTLAEIEAAADALSPEQKQELLLFVAARLRAQRAQMPGPRRLGLHEGEVWMSDDFNTPASDPTESEFREIYQSAKASRRKA